MANGITGITFENASDRIEAATAAGEQYVEDLENIRAGLIEENGQSTTLGKMVGAQLEMSEAETKYMVTAGLPKKASKAVENAAGDVKKAAG